MIIGLLDRILDRDQELKDMLGRIKMLDIPKQTTEDHFNTHIFVCFKWKTNHKRAAQKLNGQVFVDTKNIRVETTYDVATHGEEYIGCEWVNKRHHKYIAGPTRLMIATTDELSEELKRTKKELESFSSVFERREDELFKQDEVIRMQNNELAELKEKLKKKEEEHVRCGEELNRLKGNVKAAVSVLNLE